jgi:hypothetical protein
VVALVYTHTAYYATTLLKMYGREAEIGLARFSAYRQAQKWALLSSSRLVLGTASVWTWMMTQSRLLRYGMILLCSIVLVVLGGMWLLGGKGAPVVPPTTATPTLAPIAKATATPIPVRSSTSSVAMMHDTDTRTGIENVDHVIDLVLEGDVDRLRDVLAFTTVGCTYEDGLGRPPKCREEESEGTEVEVLPFLGPEGHFLRRDEAHEWSGIEVLGLYAVYRVSDDAYSTEHYPAGQVAVIFVGAREEQSVVLQVDNGRVVRIDYVFGDSPESKLEREAEEAILPPHLRRQTKPLGICDRFAA